MDPKLFDTLARMAATLRLEGRVDFSSCAGCPEGALELLRLLEL